MKSRIAIFEGYGAPFAGRPSLGRPLGRPLGYPGLGRRGYYVPPVYGPARPGIDPRPRRGYRVKKMKDTPAMKRAQNRMKKAAKKCSRRRKGSFTACMRRELKKRR